MRSLRTALRSAVEDPELADARGAQLLVSLEQLPAGAYAPIAAMRRQADALGYDEIPPG